MLAILTTHPIQYQVPLWQALARDGRVPFEVWYMTSHSTTVSHDREFGQSIAWDLDMLAGYPHKFLDTAPSATPNSFWKCRLRESLADRMREAGVKALWIQGWQVAAYWQAVWAARRLGIEVWLRGESNDLAPTPIWKRVIKRVVLGQFLQRVDRFLYIGTANRRLYEKFGAGADRLYPARYAVDNERFARQAEEIRGRRAEIRSQWKISDEAFCVLFCGKFIPKKRPIDLIKAAQSLIASNQLSNIHLLFVGSGELSMDLRSQCDVVFDAESFPPTNNTQLITNNQKPRASFAGFLNQTEISQAYVAADCLVLPSDYRETWGLVVNEAMASGLRCIISSQCGCAEDLGLNKANDIFECGDYEALSKRIQALAACERWTGEPTMPSLVETVRTTVSLYATRQRESLEGQ